MDLRLCTTGNLDVKLNTVTQTAEMTDLHRAVAYTEAKPQEPYSISYTVSNAISYLRDFKETEKINLKRERSQHQMFGDFEML